MFSRCRFTFHVEATDKVAELIAAVKAKGMGVGVALKPATPVEVSNVFLCSVEREESVNSCPCALPNVASLSATVLATNKQEVLPYCDDLDLVLIMTVEPGFGGQSFMSDQVRTDDARGGFPLLGWQARSYL